MRIRRIDIKNFRGYGENPAEEDGFYKFDSLDKPEIVVLTGYNGYGKTSLYEAVEWCITGDIKALRTLTEDANQKVTLKKSHYLKFQSMYDRREREVAVRVFFDNGRSLVRKTTCDSLHEDYYTSMIMNESQMVLDQNAVADFIKTESGQPIDKFFRLSFCGQAYSEDLVRNTSAKGRSEILMSFLGMDSINEIVNHSDAKKNLSLRKKLQNVENEISEEEKVKRRLNTLFQTNQWGSIENYRKQLGDAIASADDISDAIKAANIDLEIQLQKNSISELVESLKKSRILHERLEKIYEKEEQEKKHCIREQLIRKYKKNQIFLQGAEIAGRLDIVKLREELDKYISAQNSYETAEKEIEEQKTAMNSNVVLIQDNPDEVFFLTAAMVSEYERERNLYQKVYQESLKFGLHLEKLQTQSNIKKFLRYSDLYHNWLDTNRAVFAERKQTLSAMEGMCSRQKEMLLKVQAYVNQSDLIEKCPVCGGTEFIAENEDAKSQLLGIIENEISNGDDAIKTLNSEILSFQTQINRAETSYKEKVWKPFECEKRNLEQAINECVHAVTEYLEGMIKCNRKMMVYAAQKYDEIDRKVREYDSFIQLYGIEKNALQEKRSKVERANQWIKDMLKERFQIQADDAELPDAKQQREISPIRKKMYLEKKVRKVLEDILHYDIGEDNLHLLEQYEKISENTDKLKEKRELFQGALDFRKNVNVISKSIQTEMIQKYIEKNDLINLIYQFINPHPFFREIRFIKNGAETNIKASERDDIYLDHLFSEAQMKVLSLSIFLGLNLSVKENRFEQIYIDDPVQSMDDINMISFIDLLRCLNESQHINKNFIIGTHDYNFSKLLKIKFRHHSFIEYRFEAYTNEGPRVSRIKN